MIIVVMLVLPFALGLAAAAAKMIKEKVTARSESERARVEADLDRTQAQLRSTMLQLASELGANAHEARMAMIRESFLTTGQLPKGD